MSDPTDSAAVIVLPPTPPPPADHIPDPAPTPATTSITPSTHCKHIYWNLLSLIQHHSANHESILFNIGQTARCDHVHDLSPLRKRYQQKMGTELYDRATAVAGRLDDSERAVVRKLVGYYHDYTETCVVEALPTETWLYYQLFARSFGQIASSITLGQIGTAVTIASVAFQGGRHVNRLRREWNKQKAKLAESEAKKAATKKEAKEHEREKQHGAGHGGEVPLHMRHSQQAQSRSHSTDDGHQHGSPNGHEQHEKQNASHDSKHKQPHKSSDD